MSNKWQPLFFALCVGAGVFIGMLMSPAGKSRNFFSADNKFSEILALINGVYVDTVNYEKLEDNAINDLLGALDPHSVYIPARDLKAVNEPLEGNFEGIGVEFNIMNDTIMVVTPINGGPSQELGILAGDRIVSVDGKNVAGIGIHNDDVMHLLKGKKGTQVKVGIFRRGVSNILSFNITRNTIPIYSVDAAYKLNNTTGYVKVSRFAATTYDEFTEAVKKLQESGINNLVIDLRGNPGGYLNAATDMIDELLDGHKLMVYTEGRNSPRMDYNAKHNGLFEEGKLVVLIDEGSASASEIVAGAMQDWDRAVIVGRRSFGKGLVQEPFTLRDGSALRLTVSRYYTPSGRCIQKPYTAGVEEYEMEVMERYKKGEMEHEDSMKQSGKVQYHTENGRKVFGGGGIKPDVFVPFDTTVSSPLLTRLLSEGLISRFVFTYMDEHKGLAKSFPTVQAFDKGFDPSGRAYQELLQFVRQNKIETKPEDLARSGQWINMLMRALLARQLWKDDGYFYILNQQDRTVQKALQVLESDYSTLLGTNK